VACADTVDLDVITRGWGPEPEQHLPGPLLPPLRIALNKYRAFVERRAAEEATRGQAPQRSDESVRMRAAALLLVRDITRDLGRGHSTGLPSALARRLSSQSLAYLQGKRIGAKPEWNDLEGMVDNAGWPRLSKADSGYPWPTPEQPEGHHRHVNATALVDALIDAMGGHADDGHIVWTLGHHWAGHTPALSDNLREVLDRARDRGEPLQLYAAPEPRMGPREETAKWNEIRRLCAQGALVQISKEQRADPGYVRAVAWLGCTFKGNDSPSDDERAAIDSGNVGRIAEAARLRALITTAELAKRLRALAKESPAGARLEQLLIEALHDIVKSRPVARFQAYSRGDDRLGIDEHGIRASGFRYPQLADILSAANLSSWMLRVDCKDFFYTFPLSPEGELFGLDTHDPDGNVVSFVMMAASMGTTDSPLLAETASAALCIIANARGAASATNQGFYGMCDDLIHVGSDAEVSRGAEILVPLLDQCGFTEAAAKRIMGPEGEMLGKLIDFPNEQVTIPSARLFKYFSALHVAEQCLSHADEAVRREITPARLGKLAGMLHWLSECSTEGGAHLSYLWAAAAAGHSIRSTRDGILRNLRWWAGAARDGRLTSTLRLAEKEGAINFVVTVDASDRALGAVCNGRAAWRALSASEKTLSSTRRELLAVKLALERFGAALSGARALVLSDSCGNVFALNKGRLRGDEAGQADMEEIYDQLNRRGIYMTSFYLPREDNTAADAISKCSSAEEAQDVARGLDLRWG
jgi:hypothetical protein